MSHAHDSGHGSADAAGAASWMVAMVAVLLLGAALVVGLFVWEPWDDDGTPGGNVPGVNEGADDGIDINADVDVDGADAPEGQ